MEGTQASGTTPPSWSSLGPRPIPERQAIHRTGNAALRLELAVPRANLVHSLTVVIAHARAGPLRQAWLRLLRARL